MHERDFRNVRPGLKRVAAFAILAERAVVRIAVAGFALFRRAGEFERGMALLAIHERMLSLQCEAGFLVLELYIQTQRLPRFGGMARAARNFDIAVRMIRGRDLRAREWQRQKTTERKKQRAEGTQPLAPRPLLFAPCVWIQR